MWPNPQETASSVTFTEEILNEKLYFLCSDTPWQECSSEDLKIALHQLELKLMGKINGSLLSWKQQYLQ